MSKKKIDAPKPKGTLADQLKKLDKPGPGTLANRAPAPKKSAPTAPKTHAAQPQPPAPLAPKPLSDEELFALAINDVERADLFRAKYEGKASPLPPEPEPEPTITPVLSEQEQTDARDLVFEERERARFERAVGAVEPVENKLRPTLGRKQKNVSAAPFTSTKDDDSKMITPRLPRSGEGLHSVAPLVGSQRAMLNRFRKATIANDAPELNLRGDSLEDALRLLELFVHRHWKEQAVFVRIIHGRGLRSEDAPVLKPAVLAWLEGPGLRYVRGYIPELQAGGDYGSLIVELLGRERGGA
ncbi:MAG: Smr/MutS family protein [Bradymonadaceae bacterium]|nr:Smr/MutS family protein [Lujinxingiaceae bacterium]